ncbi:MAG: DinB family protein [Chloroflexi bacterium]|nr:DinB family protein [Chloroflexota bacterium]
MEAREIIRSQLQMTHRLLDQVLADVTSEHLRAVPDGTINPIVSIYAHLVTSEDRLVNLRALERPTVAASGGWTARTGIPDSTEPSQPADKGAWCAKVNLEAFKEYAAAVFAATDDAIANASDVALAREVEMGPMGNQPAFYYIYGIALYHCSEHTGEIAALKGVRGLKGLPF